MSYNLSAWTNSTDLLQLSIASNSLLDGLMFPLLFTAVYIALFYNYLRSGGTANSFKASSFIMFILAVLLRVAGLMSNIGVIVCIILVLIGLVFMGATSLSDNSV